MIPSFGHRDPDARGYYGEYGGRFVPETLVAPVAELERAYFAARQDPAFHQELEDLLRNYVGRATPLYEARRLSESLGGARIFLKREDLAHTGAHKINNALGQALLARRMGKRRIIAETGAGQHGVATATVCALLGLTCDVYMGAEDMERQSLNVFRMQLLGATVRRVDAGAKTLKDAINEAMRDWVTNVTDSYYLLGSVLGPHPYPLMVREFQSVIGREARAQCLDRIGRLPDTIVACVGGGSNAMGIFDAFVADRNVRLIGVEAGGHGISPGRHAARFAGGSAGILQGTRSYVLQDEHGNIELTHSISAGLDYAAVGPEHAWLHDSGRAEYAWIGDEEALAALSAAGQGRRHPAGARVVARRRVYLPPGPADAARVGAAREPVGPGRQGRAQRPEGARRRRRRPMTSRLASRFEAIKSAGRGGLVAYVTAGDPDRRRSAAVLEAVARGGADVIEVGVPFSDPLADGPVIQRASERALAAGMTLTRFAGADPRLPPVVRHADRPLHLRESRRAHGRRRVRARGEGGRRRRRAAARLPGRGGRAAPHALGRRRARSDIPDQPDNDG